MSGKMRIKHWFIIVAIGLIILLLINYSLNIEIALMLKCNIFNVSYTLVDSNRGGIPIDGPRLYTLDYREDKSKLTSTWNNLPVSSDYSGRISLNIPEPTRGKWLCVYPDKNDWSTFYLFIYDEDTGQLLLYIYDI